MGNRDRAAWRFVTRLFLLFSLFALPAAAQTTLVIGQVIDLNGIPYGGAQISAQLVFAGTPVSNPTITVNVLAQCRANGFGSAPCQIPFNPSNGPFTLDNFGNIPGGGITLQDNTQVSPANTQWAFKVNSQGNAPPLGTGAQTCSATVSIGGPAQSISGNFSNCPALSNTIGGGATLTSSGGLGGGATLTSSVQGQLNVKAFGALGDTQQLITTNGGQHQVSGGLEDCPLVWFECIKIFNGEYTGTAPFKTDGSEVGKSISTNNNGIVSTPRTPVLGVVNGTGPRVGNQYIGISATTVTGCTAGCIIPWGHNDQPAIARAKAVINNLNGTACNSPDNSILGLPCFTLFFPPGGFMSDGGGTATPGLTGLGGPSGGNGAPIRGSGNYLTTFYLTSDYNIGTLPGNFGMFIDSFTPPIGDFQITSSGFTYTFGSNPLFRINGQDSIVYPIRVMNFGNNGGTASFGGSTQEIHGLWVSQPALGNTGVACIFGPGGNMDVFNHFCSNHNQNILVTGITGTGSGSRITFHGGLTDECNNIIACTQVVASKSVVFMGGTYLGGSFDVRTQGIDVDGTSEVRVSGINVGPFGANVGGGISVQNGGKLWFNEVEFRCKNPGASCLLNLNPAGSTNVTDIGGNSYAITGGATQFGASTAAPIASLTHTWNTCYNTLTPFAASTMCNQFLDQPLTLLHIKASSNVSITCAVNPVVTITDGTTTQTLTITTGASTWDSGAINGGTKNFPLGNTITVSTTSGTCATPPTNFSVTYNMMSYGSQ